MNAKFKKFMLVFLILIFYSSVATALPTDGLVGWWSGDGNGQDNYNNYDLTLRNGTTYGRNPIISDKIYYQSFLLIVK